MIVPRKMVAKRESPEKRLPEEGRSQHGGLSTVGDVPSGSPIRR